MTRAYGEHQYKVEIARSTEVQAKDLASWVQSDQEKINQMGAPRQETSIEDIPAMTVTNLTLPGRAQGACPAVRVYARTNTPNYLIMTVSQADTGTCGTPNLERLADALVAEVRS